VGEVEEVKEVKKKCVSEEKKRDSGFRIPASG